MVFRLTLGLLVSGFMVHGCQAALEPEFLHPDTHLADDYKCFKHCERDNDPVPQALFNLQEYGDTRYDVDEGGDSDEDAPLSNFSKKRRINPHVNERLKKDARQAKRPCKDYGWQPLETWVVARDHGHPRAENIFYWLLASDENVGVVRKMIPTIDMAGHPGGKALIFLKQAIRFGAPKNMAVLLNHEEVKRSMERPSFAVDAARTATVTNQREILRTLLRRSQVSLDRSNLAAYVKRFSHLSWADRQAMIDMLAAQGADPDMPTQIPFNLNDWLYVTYCKLRNSCSELDLGL